ncbi:S41 family peptidase [Cellulophaga sp. BC115SP]|uniref:S41 family peptidase n=1 Tax=Cellulophaga sp. BC115SP TaxID=2683263 RepID=UPI001411D172|nr:S41 family peptidase [Cellulophaga sp. BC115SP]NBB30446.1 peptidase S41 [Cellulophaga sp. BC115SP]
MLKTTLFSLAAGLVSQAIVAQNSETYFASFPSISPDAQTLVYCFEGDIWKTDLNTKVSTRLTAMRGTESRPKISPDGKWLAFTGSQYGNPDVYVMPLEGGAIRQLTFHDTQDYVESWSWDSKSIYLSSGAQNDGTAYKLDLSGGTPVRLFSHFFNRIHNVAEHPTTGEIFFNDTWESDNQSTRKGYKGAFNPDIQSYNPKTKAYKRYTNYIGKDLWASIDRSGNVYFASDEANGQYNLYTFQNGQKVALTQFPEAIKRPQVSANGQKVVFEKEYQLYVYDVASKTSQKINPNPLRNYVLPHEQDFKVSGNIAGFDVSTDGKKLAYSSRGALFVSDVEGKYIAQIPTDAHGRVVEVKWLSDNKTLLFTQTTEKGYYNLFTIAADGKGKAKQLTSDEQNNRNITFNKEKTQAVYISGKNEIRVLDLKTLVSNTVVKEELWALYNPKPYFSPNGEYVMFSAYRNFEQDIFLYHLADKKLINLTNTGITETNPYWSPDGKYIYFESDRTKASYPFGLTNGRIYRIALSKIDTPFKSDKFNDLFKEEKKEEKKDEKKEEPKDAKAKGKKEPEKKPEPAPAPKIVPIVINMEGLIQRFEQISPDFGSADSPVVFQKEDKTSVLFVSNHEGGNGALYKTTIAPFTKNKTEKVEGASVSDYEVAVADGKYFALVGGNIYKLNLDGNKLDKIDLNFTFRKNLANEFQQMFYEAWAGVQENFYDEKFNGLDWVKTREKYAKFLPAINNRADLRTLLMDMLGELNASHLGFSTDGEEDATFYKAVSQNVGIVFENENPYVVKYVIKNSISDKADKDIRPGDKLVKVNTDSVETNINRDFYFSKPSLDDEISLTFERSGKTFTTKVHPQRSYAQIRSLYDEWIDQNQEYVDTKSNKRIAYVHMSDMGRSEFEKFMIDVTSEAYNREGLIFDIRNNRGGNVHDLVLNFLSQRAYLKWKYREGQFTIQPNFNPADKPIVLLINEQSLSDAEMTAQGFKQLKLGKIIGTETYRWIIFTSGKGLVDGSFYRLPSWGCYTLDGKDLEKEGVSPDISIPQTFTDRLENKDPQLDKAIEEILKSLK